MELEVGLASVLIPKYVAHSGESGRLKYGGKYVPTYVAYLSTKRRNVGRMEGQARVLLTLIWKEQIKSNFVVYMVKSRQ